MDCLRFQSLIGISLGLLEIEERAPLRTQGIVSIPNRGLMSSTSAIKHIYQLHTLYFK
jgi:hypothetical protein